MPLFVNHVYVWNNSSPMKDCFVSYFSGHLVFTADGSIMPMYLRGTETYSCANYLVEGLVVVLRSVDAHCVSF